MPYDTRWVEPELFLSHNGVNIYHTYKNDDIAQGSRLYWYSESEIGDEDDDSQFDVRDLKSRLAMNGVETDAAGVNEGDRKAIEAIIRLAIDWSILTSFDDASEEKL